MCFNDKQPANQAIDLPVRRPSGGPPTIDELPKESKTPAIGKAIRDAQDRYKVHLEEKKLAKTYGALVTTRNVNKIVDRQNAEDACQDRKVLREEKCNKWVDGVAQETKNGQSSK